MLSYEFTTKEERLRVRAVDNDIQLNTTFELFEDFYSNALLFWELFKVYCFCTYLSTFSFSGNNIPRTRDYCVEGAYIELYYNTKMGSNW